MNLPDYLNAINSDKKNIIRDNEAPDAAEKAYPKYAIARCLAQHIDSVMWVNDMNIRGVLPYQVSNRQHFEYLLHSLQKKKRFSKIDKETSDEHIDLLVNMGMSRRKALDVVDLLTDEQYKQLAQSQEKGGDKKR